MSFASSHSDDYFAAPVREFFRVIECLRDMVISHGNQWHSDLEEEKEYRYPSFRTSLFIASAGKDAIRNPGLNNSLYYCSLCVAYYPGSPGLIRAASLALNRPRMTD